MTNINTGVECLHIGLSGLMGCGKGEVARLLAPWGFRSLSLGDMVREEAAKLGRPVSRTEMQDIGNRLRIEGGAGALGARVREKITGANPPHPLWLIDGIRNPLEIIELRRLPNFFLLFIDARHDILLDRLSHRARVTDLASADELERRLRREWGEGEPPEGQHVGKCKELADEIIPNNDSLEALQQLLEITLEKFRKGALHDH